MNETAKKDRGALEVLDLSAGGYLAGISRLSFQRLIENVADGILVVDLSGSVLYANPAAAHVFGLPIEELLHVPLGRPVVSGETTEITIRRPGKASAEVEMRVVELSWDGRAALLASLRDVSAQRAADERRRQAQKMEAVGRLAAGIVHDFNNLLAVLEAGLNLLGKQISEDPAHPKTTFLLEEMRKRIQNGGALTQQLLAFSRRQSLSPELVDVNDRIESLSTLLERTLGKGVKINRKLDSGLDRVLIDPNQFDVAILNLAVNARDAMEGKGTLIVETAGVADGGEEFAPGTSLVRISVRDTGCGMSQQTLSRVFEPFFTTKPEGEGTGLGLSQVYGFVSQSGGQVRIDSAIGKGTSVHLFLPSARHTNAST